MEEEKKKKTQEEEQAAPVEEAKQESAPPEAEELPTPPEEKQEEKPEAEEPAVEVKEASSEEAAPAEEPPAPAPNEELLLARAELAAIKNGMDPAVVEDAVYLALRDARKEGGALDEGALEKALKGVLKRHPEWDAKAKEKQAGGFKVGADGAQPPVDQDAIAQAFGNGKG